MSGEPVQSVSIITPSFQQRPFIEQTLLSVVGQRGDFDLDYIVVDGGSTDGTVELLEEFERRLAANQPRKAAAVYAFAGSARRTEARPAPSTKAFAWRPAT